MRFNLIGILLLVISHAGWAAVGIEYWQNPQGATCLLTYERHPCR